MIVAFEIAFGFYPVVSLVCNHITDQFDCRILLLPVSFPFRFDDGFSQLDIGLLHLYLEPVVLSRLESDEYLFISDGIHDQRVRTGRIRYKEITAIVGQTS